MMISNKVYSMAVPCAPRPTAERLLLLTGYAGGEEACASPSPRPPSAVGSRRDETVWRALRAESPPHSAPLQAASQARPPAEWPRCQRRRPRRPAGSPQGDLRQILAPVKHHLHVLLSGDQNGAGLLPLGGADKAALLHLVDELGGPPVAERQAALNQRG